GKRAEEELLALYGELLPRNVGSNGMSYGLSEMDRAERIEAFLWRVSTGAVDILAAISPVQFREYVDEFLDDVSKTPMYAQSPQIQRMRAELERMTAPMAGE